MEESLIGALRTLTSLQRWNFLPRVDFWTEAENVAYVTHMGYAFGRANGLNEDQLRYFLVRSLLKSFNKHFLSDIPVPTREALKDLKKDVWENLVNETADKTSKLFPRKIAEEVATYLTHGGNYDAMVLPTVETLLKYAQNMVAREECKTNQKVYLFEYNATIASINDKILAITSEKKSWGDEGTQNVIFKERLAYFSSIKRLKYLRRWNIINRNIESSVLSHTFMVAFLAFLFSRMCADEIDVHYAYKNKKGLDDFLYKAILRALFHDVPEALTGDIPSPVKILIQNVDRTVLSDVEKRLVEKEINANAPEGVRQDIERYNLLSPFEKNPPKYSIESLVKECDKLALVMECLFERQFGTVAGEMMGVYHSYLNDLLNSEWAYIREFCARVLLEFPFSDSGRGT
ncbi:MAG: HD domain-containing protein [Nitrospirae bacterium]|nr:HD domain-containing protein [Nitrospirota bacterium]